MATATQAWSGEVEIRTILYPTGKYTAKGKEILRKSVLRRIILSHRQYGCIPFNVTHRHGFTSVTDHREEETGAGGTTGVWGTRDAAKTGRARSYTPSGWVEEVKHLIGEGEAKALLLEAGWDG